MPAIDEGSFDTDDERLLRQEDDYRKIILHFRKKVKKGRVLSLTSIAGLESATEAYFFFQELQARLAPIRILGNNADELWCRLDWCNLILGMWVRRKGFESGRSMEEWMSIMESWKFIIESTASMDICFGLPSGDSQRVALNEDEPNATSHRMLRTVWCYRNITKDDEKLVNWVLRAAQLHEGTISLRHDRPFRSMMAHLRGTLEEKTPEEMLLQQRRRGMEASDFEEYVADIEQETHLLLGFLTAEEKEDLEFAFVRILKAVVSDPVAKQDVRYLQICQKISSEWLSGNEMLQSEVDKIFHQQVQETFGHIVTRNPHDWDNVPAPPVDKDLSDVLALGANIRGELYGTTDSILHVIASRNCPLSSFKALIAAGAPYKNDSDYGASPLYGAAGANNTDVIAFLLDRGLHTFAVDINDRDWRGRSALHWAAHNCCTDAIDMLLQQPEIKYDAKDQHSFTPLAHACHQRHLGPMKRLLRDPRSLTELVSSSIESFRCRYASDRRKYLSPITLVLQGLQGTSKRRLTDVNLALMIVLAAKPDLEVRTPDSELYLDRVINAINTRMLQDISSAGADLSSRDYDGKSFIRRAIKAVDGDIQQELLRVGIDVTSQGYKGKTSMHELLRRWFLEVEKLRMLLGWGTSPDIENHYGEDPVTAKLMRHDETRKQAPTLIIRNR